jgi:hypothetical protein
MKIVHKINKDSNDFADQISEEGKIYKFLKKYNIFFLR